MPQAVCPRYAFGRRMRVTALDGCGRPLAGAKNSVVTTGFTAVDISPNVLAGDDITVKNAGGDPCIVTKALDSIKWLTVKITLCTQDPDLIKLLNPTWYEEVDEGGNPIGFRVDTSTTYASAFALELWQDMTGVDFCASGTAQGGWGYLLLPFCQGGTLGDISITNKEALTVFNGRTLPNPKWGVGPYNVRQDPSGNPKPLLTQVAATQPLVWFATSLSPPTATCGGVATPPMTLPAPSPAPTQVGAGTLSTITAAWTAVAGASGYTVSAVLHGTTNPVFSTTVPVTALQGTITGLTAGQTYDVTVTANGDGVNTLTSVASAVGTMTTAAAHPLPAPTLSQNPTIANAQVGKWGQVTNASAPYYVAQVFDSTGTTLIATGTLSGLPATPQATFTGLTGGTSYKFSVIAKGDNLTWGDSPAATATFTA